MGWFGGLLGSRFGGFFRVIDDGFLQHDSYEFGESEERTAVLIESAWKYFYKRLGAPTFGHVPKQLFSF